MAAVVKFLHPVADVKFGIAVPSLKVVTSKFLDIHNWDPIIPDGPTKNPCGITYAVTEKEIINKTKNRYTCFFI